MTSRLPKIIFWIIFIAISLFLVTNSNVDICTADIVSVEGENDQKRNKSKK